jgi:CheY-like chemotaxis protein
MCFARLDVRFGTITVSNRSHQAPNAIFTSPKPVDTPRAWPVRFGRDGDRAGPGNSRQWVRRWNIGLRIVLTPQQGINGMANILLVDDDEFVVDFLRDAIQGKAHTVQTACDGHEGLFKFSMARFDLAITDINMPEMEGIGMMRQMHREAPDMKIVAMSGGDRTGNFQYLRMARELGAAATLRKPIHLTALYDVMAACLLTSP